MPAATGARTLPRGLEIARLFRIKRTVRLRDCAGRKDDANNSVPYVVYVWLWVELAALSLIFGPIWAWLNPIRLLHTGLARLARLARLDPESSMTAWFPGYWPAALGLFAFTWLELIAPDRTTLPVLRVAIGTFVLIDLLGALVFGRGWFTRCGPFEVWSRLYGSLSPLARRPHGSGSCVHPWPAATSCPWTVACWRPPP